MASYFREQFVEDNFTNKPLLAYNQRHQALQVLKITDKSEVSAVDYAHKYIADDLPEATWSHYNDANFILLLGWMTTKQSTALLTPEDMKYTAESFRKGKEVAFRYLKTGYTTLQPDSAGKHKVITEPLDEPDIVSRDHEVYYFWNNVFYKDQGPLKGLRTFVPLRHRMNLTGEDLPFYYSLEGVTFNFAPMSLDHNVAVTMATNVTPLLRGSKVWDSSRYKFVIWPEGIKYINFSREMIKYSGEPLMIWLRQFCDHRLQVRVRRVDYEKFLKQQHVKATATMKPNNIEFVTYVEGETKVFVEAGGMKPVDQALLDLIGEFDDDDDI